LAMLYDSDALNAHQDRAVEILRESFERQPQHVGCRAALVQIALRRDVAEARRLLDSWPADQRDAQFLIRLGSLQQEHDCDYAAAAENFRRVLEVHPENWKVRHRLAACLRGLGQTEQAVYQEQRQERIADALK